MPLVPIDKQVTDQNGHRWTRCRDEEQGDECYVHDNCDARCDLDGFCLMCACPSPGAPSQRPNTRRYPDDRGGVILMHFIPKTGEELSEDEFRARQWAEDDRNPLKRAATTFPWLPTLRQEMFALVRLGQQITWAEGRK